MGNFIFDDEGRAVKSGIDHAIHRLNDQQKKAREVALDCFETARNAKQDWMEDLSKEYNSYHQILKERLDDEEEGEVKAKISTPDTFAQLEHVLAKERAAIFPANLQEDIIRLIPQNLESLPFIEPNEVLLNYQFRMMNIRSDKGTVWLRNFLMFGFGPIFPYWREEHMTIPYREPIQVVDPMTGKAITLGYMAPRDRRVLKASHPDFKLTDPEDYYPDPAALAYVGDQMRFCCDLYYRPYERLKALTQAGLYDKDMFALIDSKSAPPQREYYGLDRRTIFRRYDNYEFMNPKGIKGMVEIIDVHTKNWIITIANRNIPLRARRKPYYLDEMCMVCPTRLKQSNEPQGVSLLRPLVPIHNIVNALTNLRLDSLRYAVQKFFTILEGTVSKEKLKTARGVLEVLDHDDIKEREFKDVTTSVYKEVEVQLAMMEKASGLNSAAIADAANIRSGVQQIAAAEITGERNQMDIDSFVHGGLIPLAQICHAFNQQFITDEKLIPVVGSNYDTNFIRVPIESLYGQFQFTVSAAAKSIPTAVEARQKLELVNSMIPILAQFPDLLMMLYKQISQDSHYSELASVLDVVAMMVQRERENQGGVLPPGGRQTQNAQGSAGFSGMAGSPSDDIATALSGATSAFEGGL